MNLDLLKGFIPIADDPAGNVIYLGMEEPYLWSSGFTRRSKEVKH